MKDRWGVEHDDAPGVGKTPRWAAATVMLTACAGFVGLAYYAYNAGTRVMREDEVALVEADSAPVKEKPANPGGMQFPNQDKTIFQAASNQPPKTDTVERVLPAPEEPVNRKQVASNQGKDWINEKLSDAAADKNSTQAALVEKPAAPVKTAEAAAAMAPAAGGEGASSSGGPAPQQPPAALPAAVQAPSAPAVTATPAPAAAAPAAPPKVELKQEAPAESEQAEEKPAEKPVAKKAASHKGMVQLGSYRSEAEANHAWKKLHGKYKDLLPAKPELESANLGEKGTYFRLRAHVADPKAVCGALTSKGQACIVVK